MIRLFKALILFTLVLTSFIEVAEADHLDSDLELSSFEVSANSDQLQEASPCADCDDCNDCEKGCTDSSGHCCHSVCMSPMTFITESDSSIPAFSFSPSSKIDWYFYNNYRSPFPDPSLKPPLFS